MVYLQERKFNVNDDFDSFSFLEAMLSLNSSKWRHAIEVEIKSMYMNDVWDLVELPMAYQPIRCKWIFKTKRIV